MSLSLNDFNVYLRSDKGKWRVNVEMTYMELASLVGTAGAILAQVDGQR
jgi:hypothetical protein